MEYFILYGYITSRFYFSTLLNLCVGFFLQNKPVLWVLDSFSNHFWSLFVVGLDHLEGLFQPKRFDDSVVSQISYASLIYVPRNVKIVYLAVWSGRSVNVAMYRELTTVIV